MKDESLSSKRIIYSNASGRGLVRYEEEDVKEFVKKLREGIKDHGDEYGGSEWILKDQVIKEIDNLAGKELI